ncbi:MAG: bifunctional phosphoribosyl-AMP cyclohydrolase/phosphoribosyl-ATP diphosphatase HisIE, partial [Bacteroidales bacterium]|nr:bifunctional phosphoribosyl-AMP cyclohydrolase/phosphoribosyl-ATP diphosphatase HisIE [Bacteroidales bacterium]
MNTQKQVPDFGKNPDGLVPAIIQDNATRKVLMLGYMNQEAYEKTLGSGLVTFWSRSRKQLWTKGETSGNYLHLVDIFLDCDEDTLLVTVIPDGPTCHRGTVSCFDTPPEEGFLGHLEQVIRDRHAKMPSGHYTTHLFGEGVKKISQKVGEEAVETILEAA